MHHSFRPSLFAILLLVPAGARAEPESSSVEQPRVDSWSNSPVTISALAGFLWDPRQAEFGQPETIGALGVRGGYTFRIPVYLGASLTLLHSTGTAFVPGIEGGYDLHWGPLLVRPTLGIGALVSTASPDVDHLTVWPSVLVAYAAGPIYVGAGVRGYVANEQGFAAFLENGVRF